MRRETLPLFLLLLGAAGPAAGQFAPPGTGGVAALADALQQLGAEKRVLVIAAHPDDENTQMLTLVARGLGGRAAYLSLTRGEGGQNLIGPELGQGLGVIRSEELLAARALDGAEQFFTRAYDYGFSRSADEAFRFWPRDSVLADVIAVIRRFRPQIIVAQFWGGPGDGHGQHQVSGLLATQAYEILRDSAWGPVKFYRRTIRPTDSSLTISTGAVDPLLGNSYAQIAAASRSRHRSQDFGALQIPGPSTTRITLVHRRAPGPDTSLFSGVDTVLRGPTAARFVALVDSARARLNPWRPAEVLPLLLRAHALVPAGDAERRATLDRAIAIAAGVAIDAVADDEIIAAGQRLGIQVAVWNSGGAPVTLESVEVASRDGWRSSAADTVPISATVAHDAVGNRRFAVDVPADAPRSAPYFARRPMQGAMYDWTGVPAAVRGMPFEPPPLEARVRLTVGGVSIALVREVVYRFRDQAVGEVRRPLVVTRPFDVAVSPDMLVWPVDGGATRQITLTVTNRTRGPATARLRVTVPDGWRPVPAETLSFVATDESRMLTVRLQAPQRLRPSQLALQVTAVGGDGQASEGTLVVIDYPHIRPRPTSEPSRSEIHAARIALPGVRRVGYVRGASDRVPEELLAVGVPVELLGAETLARGDLSQYDAIVIGSRAYETDAALMANNARVLEYARNGGLVIVQYQQYQYVDGGFAPYPLTIARPHDRVTDETAAVRMLDSTHAALRAPNAIGASDWDGWVQERGLYFAHDWDARYTPLLEMNDAGNPALQGSVLVAPLGRGTYVYTGLSFFRQLPAGVPGAYRLFMNLLNLGQRSVP